LIAPLILDASFVAAYLLEETHTPFVVATLDERSGTDFMSTSLLTWEVGNILRTRRRAGHLSSALSTTALEVFFALDIRCEPSLGETGISEIGDVADRHGLSVYDAGYLELAQRMEGELATLDRRLAVAAIAAGRPVRSPFS